MAAAGSSNEEADPFLCAVCLDEFKEPRFLPCFHSYCTRCIEDVARKHSNHPFPCPACRKKTIMPPGGVQGFQVNFYASAYIENKTRLVPPQSKKAAYSCNIHEDIIVRFYCCNCKTPFCRECKKMGTHDGHQTDDLNDVVENVKANIVEAKTIWMKDFESRVLRVCPYAFKKRML
jgi:hypothetical protein